MNIAEIAAEISAAKSWLRAKAAGHGVHGVLHEGLMRLEQAEQALISHVIENAPQDAEPLIAEAVAILSPMPSTEVLPLHPLEETPATGAISYAPAQEPAAEESALAAAENTQEAAEPAVAQEAPAAEAQTEEAHESEAS